jgi:hypothetical protein
MLDDNKDRKAKLPPVTIGPNRVAELWPQIAARQAEGYGVFVAPNGGFADGDVTKIEALFIDFDGKPLPTQWHMPPSLIATRDDEHAHVYWRVENLPVEDFRGAAERLVARYGSDPSIKSPSHLMRLPGTLHQKVDRAKGLTGAPVPYQLVSQTAAGTVYTATAILDGLPEPEKSPHEEAAPHGGAPPITVAEYRKILSFIDPTFADNRLKWFGVMRCIMDENVELVAGEEAPDGEELALEWTRGDLWRERTGDKAFDASTYLDDEECLDNVRARRRDGGAMTGLWTLVKLANAGGFRDKIGPSAGEAFGHFADEQPNPDPGGPDPSVEEFHAWTLDELAALPPVEWLIPGVLQKDGFAILFGPTNKGKTFALLALLLPLAREGHDIVYITGTGESSKAAIGQRARAWAKHHGPEAVAAVSRHFRVMDKAPFESEAMARRFCESLRSQGLSPAVVVIDTLSAAMEGDENAARDVQAFFKIAGIAERELNCLTFLVHHTGKDVARGERGNSRIRGGVNTSFELTHDDGDDFVALHNRKQREAEKLKVPLCFKWQVVDGTLVYLPASDDERKREAAGRRLHEQLRPVFTAIMKLKRASSAALTTHVLAAELDGAITGKKRSPEEVAAAVDAREKWLQRHVWDGKAKRWGPLRTWVLEDSLTGEPIKPYIWIDATIEDAEEDAAFRRPHAM